MRVNIINLENGKTLSIQLPAHLEKYRNDFRKMDFTDDTIRYGKVRIEKIDSGIEYVDKIVNELKDVNINELNYLSLCIYDHFGEQREKYNAILKFEYIRDNIKKLNDLIQMTFEENYYSYESNARDIKELSNKIKSRSPSTRRMPYKDVENVIQYFCQIGNGCFSEYNNKMGYVMCLNKEKINKRKEISDYRMRDWEGNQYEFKTDIITALGVTIVANGTLYNSEELLYSVNLNYGDCIEQLEKLTGRTPKKVFSEISEKYGVTSVYLGDERLIDFEILEEQEETEEFE